MLTLNLKINDDIIEIGSLDTANDKGIISYDQAIENEMNEYCRLELMKYSDARKFFSCG